MDFDNTIESLQKIIEPMKEEISVLDKRIEQENNIVSNIYYFINKITKNVK